MNVLGSLCMCACERGLLSNQDWLVGSVMLAGNWKRNTYFSAPYKALWFWGLSCRHACQGSLISHTHTHRRQSDSSLNSDTFTAVKFFIFWMDAHPVLPVLFTLGINIRFKQSVWYCMPNTHPNGVQNIWPTCTIHVQPNFCVCAAVCVDVWVIWALRKKDPCASICTHGQWSLLSKACLFN